MWRALDILFPRLCRVCDTPLADDEEHLCALCQEELPRSLYHLREHHPMEERFAGIIPFVRADSWLLYSRGSSVADMIHDFKYRRMPSLARSLGRMMGEEYMVCGVLGGVDALMPVPMHWWKRACRGYNQAEELALGVREGAGLPVITNLRAVRPHRTQTSMTLGGRVRNMRGVFGVSRPEELDGRHVCLVDDVCTTGSTLLSAAEALLAAAPGCRLSLLVMASTV
ncbi:MAG: ComF family protein [Muribaculaceae bacterium]|nr:ComF family protein [Muribaculaceae bacterium]